MIRNRRRQEYESLIPLIEAAVAKALSNHRPSSPSPKSKFGELLTVGTAGQINGTLTSGDVINAALLFGVGFVCGGVISITEYVTTNDIGFWWRDGTRLGAYGTLTYLVADGIAFPFLASFWDSVGSKMDEMMEAWREHRKPPVREVRPIYFHDGREPEGEDDDWLLELPNGQSVWFSSFQSLIENACDQTDGTDGKSWAREAWCGQSQNGYPDMRSLVTPQLTTRQWAGAKELCEEVSEQYPAFQRGLWRTNDRNLTRQLLEMLEEDPSPIGRSRYRNGE